MELPPTTSAISRRHTSARGEVQAPLGLESPADPFGPTFQQRIPYSLESPQRLAVDALRSDDHQTPADLIELLAPEDVGQPLPCVLGMLPAVVFDDEPEVLVCQVVPPAPTPATAIK